MVREDNSGLYAWWCGLERGGRVRKIGESEGRAKKEDGEKGGRGD